MDPFLYLDRATIVHRLDPRTKLLLLAVMFGLPFLFSHPLYELTIFAGAVLLAALARSMANLRRIWFVLVAITVMSIVLWPIFGNGQTSLFAFVELEPVLYGVSMALRINTTIVAGMIFLSTTRTEEVTVGLARIGIPYSAAFSLSTAFRMVPTIIDTAYTISQAQRSRGLDLESGNIIRRIRKYIPLMVPVFISTVRSTNVFSMALESKGFDTRKKRTFLLQTSIRKADIFALLIFVAALCSALFLSLSGLGHLEGFDR